MSTLLSLIREYYINTIIQAELLLFQDSLAPYQSNWQFHIEIKASMHWWTKFYSEQKTCRNRGTWL